MAALSGAYGRGYGYFPGEMNVYAVSSDSRNQVEPGVARGDDFPQATASREGAFSMSLENREIALGSKVAVYDPMTWTEEMNTRLVALKGTGEEEFSWIEIAFDINRVFGTNMTPEVCEQQYQEVMQRFSFYSTTSDEGLPIVNIEHNEGHSRDVEVNVDGDKAKSASDDERRVKRRNWVKDRRMEWNKERDERLESVFKQCRAEGKGYWARITQKLNFEFGEKRDETTYQDRWRKVSRGILDGVPDEEEQATIKEAIQSGKYYKFSKEGLFEGIAYTDVGRLARTTSAIVCRMFDKKESKDDPFFKRLKTIEDRRREGEAISKETFYKWLREFAPKPALAAMLSNG
jgi:hypothetical protein